jgi:hypothetical protein
MWAISLLATETRVQGQQLIGPVSETVTPRFREGFGGKLAPQQGVREEFLGAVGERRNILDTEEIAVDPVSDEIPISATVKTDNRQAARHGLQKREPKRLRPRRMQIDSGISKMLFRIRHDTVKNEAALKAFFLRQCLQRFAMGSIAEDVQIDIDTSTQ